MTTERIDIIVSERGSRVVRRNIENIGTSAQKAEGGLKLLKRALGALATGAAVVALQRLVDTYTNLQNRLRLVTKGTAHLNTVTEKLFDIANRTRSSFEGTAEVFARTALALKDLGVSQQETLSFTESLNQAIILSGASAQEAQAGMIQLSQGLASGTLRGDELRSVLEQLPAVADVIAKGLGVTRGELRKLGEAGKITAKDILGAFRDAREELVEKFAKTVPTIGQALVVLRNNLMQFVGGLDTATGASAAIAQAILGLASNMKTLGRVVGALAIALGITFGVKAIGLAITGIKALTAAIAINPLGFLLVGLTTAISFLIAFSDKITLAKDSVATLGDLFTETAEVISNSIGGALDFFAEKFSGITDITSSVFGDVEFSIKGVLRATADVVDSIIGMWRGSYNVIVATFENLPNAFIDIFTRALNGAISLVEGGVNYIIGILNKLPGVDIGATSVGRISNGASGGAASLGKAMAEAWEKGFEDQFARGGLERILAGAENRAKARLEALQAANAERQRALAELNKAGKDLTLGAEARNALLKAEEALLKSIKGPLKDYKRDIEALNSLYAKGKISLREYSDTARDLKIALLDTQTDLASGFERGLLKVGKDFEDMASLSERLVVNAFKGMEDALVKFVQTGKLDFKSLADSILADLTRISLRQAAMSIFGGGSGGGFGSIIGALGGLFGGTSPTPAASALGAGTPFANGGLVVGPGGPRDDRIRADLSNGEFVMNAQATRENLGALNAMNNGKSAGVATNNYYTIHAEGAEAGVEDRIRSVMMELAGPGVTERRAVGAVVDERARNPRLFGST